MMMMYMEVGNVISVDWFYIELFQFMIFMCHPPNVNIDIFYVVKVSLVLLHSAWAWSVCIHVCGW